MTDNLQIQTSRLISSGSGSLVDNDVANFENAVRTIFGITADSDLSAAFSIGTGPDMSMVGDLTLAGAPTADLHAATKAYVDAFSGTAATVRASVSPSTEQTIPVSSSATMTFGTAEIETGGNCWDAGNATRIVFPEDGAYLIGGSISCRNTDQDDTAGFYVSIKQNGSTTIYDKFVLGTVYATNQAIYDEYTTASFALLDIFDATDYIELVIETAIYEIDIQTNSRVYIMKVGG